ncbi:MAG TPA: Xaa-Pro aminopeptidase [Candidatus Saccharimonadales bacterium]|nr:Xaa-Pro aminopeptidase [Candidatus Saccharimonadales bacterium]
MGSFFTSQFFTSNRANLRKLFTGTAPIVITANGMLQRGGDSTYAFNQDASFWYFTGIDNPDVILVMDKNQDYLIVPELSPVMEFFDGAIDLNLLSERSGIKDIYYAAEGFKKLESRLKKVKHVATLAALPLYEEHYHFYPNPARNMLTSRLKSYNNAVELLDLSTHVTRLRVIKQKPELMAIQVAIDLTSKAIKSSMTKAKLQKYAYEYELEAELTKYYRRAGSEGHAFDPIVAGGLNACTLHSVANNSPLSSKDLILVDTGASVEHYAADITRTYTINNPTKRQQAVYDATLEVQDYALKLLRPGVIMKEYEYAVELYMGEKLRELGLIKTISYENVRKYYPSATSHFLGLNVHDVGDYSRPLEAGMVLTVEPGIYIREEAIGVRIEDDVVITDDGLVNLSKRLPKSISLN